VNIGRLIDVSLVIVFYAGYQGGKYFMNNRVQELGIAITLGLFFYGAGKLAWQRQANLRWVWWFWSAPLLVIYIMVSSSLAFSFNAGTGIVPSLFAAREFLILFLAPTLYFLYRLGYSPQRLERVFVISLIVIIFNYLFHYFRIDLQSAYFSTGYMSYLVTYDEWRGYRLKPPTFALITLTLYGSMRLFQRTPVLRRLGWVLMLAVLGYVWFLIKARSQMATVVLAFLLYPVFFSRPSRMNLFLLVAPFALFVLLAASSVLVDQFMNAEGAEVRAASYRTAFDNIAEYPVFGYGQSSGYSMTYQDIFGPKFFPSDLGIVGITFKYGLVGLFLYLFYNVYLFRRLLISNWRYRFRHRVHNPLLWSLLLLITGLTVNFILNPGLAYMQGLTTASLIIGLTSAYRDEFSARGAE
jgi:hypothetical protein